MAKVKDNKQSFDLGGIHHVAYRCHNAKETVKFYESVLGMKYESAFSEDTVPSTGEHDPYMHVFLNCGGGNIIAFFELPAQTTMGRDENTPEWVQHIAFKVPSMDALIEGKKRAEEAGLEVIGPTNHGIFHSVYFFDPNGHRLELAYHVGTPEQHKMLKDVAWEMLDEWDETKKAPRHAAWLHNQS